MFKNFIHLHPRNFFLFDETEKTTKEIINKKNEIIKIIVANKSKKDSFINELLNQLEKSLTKSDFEEFASKNEIDLNEYFKSKITEEKQPIENLDTENPSILNLLASRTFSESLSLKELKEIYTNLYNLHPIAREMITYTAALISKDNNIKIFFKDGNTDGSHYNPYDNVIVIENEDNFASMFTRESVFIHELGHFVYQQLFDNDAAPFNLNELEDKIRSLKKNDMYYYHSLLDYFTTFEYKLIQDLPALVSDNLDTFFNYEKAARGPADHAAKLLGINSDEYSNLMFAFEYLNYLKDNSYIDLFIANALKAHNMDKNIDHSIIHSIIKLYMRGGADLTINYLPPSQEEIIDWALEKLLPEVIKKFKLSPKEIFFLERISDYINRGESIIFFDEEGSLYNYNNDISIYSPGMTSELIVRAMELRSAKAPKIIIDSFSKLEEFHLNYSSPLMQSYIQESSVANMNFDIELIGEA